MTTWLSCHLWSKCILMITWLCHLTCDISGGVVVRYGEVPQAGQQTAELPVHQLPPGLCSQQTFIQLDHLRVVGGFTLVYPHTHKHAPTHAWQKESGGEIETLREWITVTSLCLMHGFQKTSVTSHFSEVLSSWVQDNKRYSSANCMYSRITTHTNTHTLYSSPQNELR